MNTSKTGLFYEFDGFRVDAGQKCLWYGDNLVPLTGKAFDTLLVLVQHKGRLVEKDALLNEVWANTFVEESTLAQNISTLRKAFAAQENAKQFIETIPRRGYRFLGDVREVIEEDELYVVETRTSTRVLAEKTETHESGPVTFAATFYKYFSGNKVKVVVGSFICIAVLAGIFISVRRIAETIASPHEKFSQIEMHNLVSSGDIYKMALSPDGKYIASIERKDAMESLQLRQTNSSGTVEIIPPSTDEFIGITFSPDSESIYYSVYQNTQDKPAGFKIGVLYKVASLGGPRTEVVRDIDSPVAVSPDGRKFAFVRYSEGKAELMIQENGVNGASEKAVAVRPVNERFAGEGLSWSPDGKSVATVALSKRDPVKHMEIVLIDTESGEQKFLTAEPWSWAGQTAWLKDGTAILFPGYSFDSPNITDDIWLATVSDGKIRRIAGGVNGILGISTNADSTSIAAVKTNRASSLWVSSKAAPDAATIINKSIGDNCLGALGMDWTPNSKIVYSTAIGGNADIWIVDSDGTHAKQLTDDPKADFSPAVSSDGRFVVFISNRSASNSILRMNLDGTNVKELATLLDASSPSISPDGRWVYFSGNKNADSASLLWRVPAEGGEIIQLTDRACLFPKISPDGKFVVSYYPRQIEPGKFSRPLRPTILTSDGSQIVKQFIELDKVRDIPLSWTADGAGFSFFLTSNGVSNIWIQNTDGGPPEKVTDFHTDEIFRYGWSRDGKMLAFEKGLKVNDVLLISDKGK